MMSQLERIFNYKAKAFIPFVSLEARQILSDLRMADLREEAHEKRLRREAKYRRHADTNSYSSQDTAYPTVNIIKRR